MQCDFTISVYARLGAKDEHGEWVEGIPTWVKDIEVDIQPYSRTRLMRDYGFDIECTNRIFTNDVDTDIKVNTVIMWGSLTFKVQKIIPWENYMEVVVLQIE